MPELQESEVGQKEVIDLSTLPTLPLSDRRKLPNCSAVYFVTDANCNVLYIGSCKSLVLRWLQHDKYERIITYPAPHITWLETPEEDLLEVEGYFVRAFAPPLNSLVPKPRNIVKVREVGGCLMFTIPQTIARTLALSAGDEVWIDLVDTEDGQVIRVEPVKKSKGKTK